MTAGVPAEASVQTSAQTSLIVATTAAAAAGSAYKGCKRGDAFTYRLQGQVSYYAGSKYVVQNGWSPTMRAVRHPVG
ncbi:hypothetical protein ABT158_26695 [Nonomuraea sp. NPDC001636]|uniref:hypothetical protein n=1 Tax=Nonomuraea sp. NPDC001636 TaxID=3154391 RepID=UPI0033274FDD